ncbi:hypothetical protein BJ912DRAFT_1068213 [Pholiota molesta]|nr:hypothetical protein BJ912DRAFT_1068213 [Pholiota molesta]
MLKFGYRKDRLNFTDNLICTEHELSILDVSPETVRDLMSRGEIDELNTYIIAATSWEEVATLRIHVFISRQDLADAGIALGEPVVCTMHPQLRAVTPYCVQSLYRDYYNPEISSWDDVVNHAETIEIAESITSAKNNRSSNDAKPKNGHGSNGGSNAGGSREYNRSRTGSSKPSNSYRSNNRKSSDRARSANPSQTGSNRGASSTPRPSNNAQRGQTPRSNGSSSNTSKPKLSDKDKADYLAAGKCFSCGEHGHMSRNCPTNSTVHSSSSKPPGLSNHNIEIVTDEEPENSEEELSDEVIHVQSLTVNSIQYLDDLFEEIPMPQYALEQGVPYPGDKNLPIWETELIDPYRFTVIPGFYDALGDWYAQILSNWTGVADESQPRIWPMGDPFGTNAELVLRSAIRSLYPTNRPWVCDDSHFDVLPRGNLEWIIHDEDFPGRPVSITITELADSHFDLCNWYRIHRYGRNYIVRPVPPEPMRPALFDVMLGQASRYEPPFELSSTPVEALEMIECMSITTAPINGSSHSPDSLTSPGPRVWTNGLPTTTPPASPVAGSPPPIVVQQDPIPITNTIYVEDDPVLTSRLVMGSPHWMNIIGIWARKAEIYVLSLE